MKNCLAAKKSTKAFRGKKRKRKKRGCWPELEKVLQDWVNTQRTDNQGVSIMQILLKVKTIVTKMKIEDIAGRPL